MDMHKCNHILCHVETRVLFERLSAQTVSLFLCDRMASPRTKNSKSCWRTPGMTKHPNGARSPTKGSASCRLAFGSAARTFAFAFPLA